MSDAHTFREAIRRIRSGDDEAAAELVRTYEPLIRREVRMHLEDARLRRMFDSMDVVQSVLASFFVRAAAGEYDLDSAEQLAGLLVKITRNKVASAARKQYRNCRDMRRVAGGDEALQLVVTADPAPGDEVANQELLGALRGQLTSDERKIADLRATGNSWDEVAAALGGKAQARRMQLARGVERAARQLGLSELYE
jgi:RNA polymerase sigma-70 factor (ECF subfamily)